MLFPVTGAAGRLVVDAALFRKLDDVVEVADGVLLQADTPMPTATAPRAASSLRTLRGYPRGHAGAFAPVTAWRPRGCHGPALGSSQLNSARLQM